MIPRTIGEALAPEGTARRRVIGLVCQALWSWRTRGLRQTLAATRAYLRLPWSADPLYRQWMHERHPSQAELAGQREWAQVTVRRPTITLVLAVPAERVHLVADTVASVRAQSYPHWELCLAHAPAATAALTAILERRGWSDARVRRTALTANASSWRAWAVAAELATGEYVAALDPGDVLAPHALYEITKLLEEDPDVDVVYTDEDRLADRGSLRREPTLKPGWSPELLLAYDYFGRLTAVRRCRLIEVGGLRPELESAQLWDVALRLAERTERIRHIPKVLCHRRTPAPRPPPDDPQAVFHRRALEHHLRRRGLEPDVHTRPDGTQRATWRIADPPLVSIIIPTRDKPDLIRKCVDGLLRGTSYPRKEIVLVDTFSVDPDVHAFYDGLRRDGLVTIVPFERDFNYSSACNAGARAARGELLLFLNNDIEVRDPGWLEELVRFAELPGVGIVGTKLLYPGGVVQHAGVVIGMHMCGLIFNRTEEGAWGPFGSADVYRNYLAVMGACQMIRRDVFERVGGYDERYRVANSDVAICLRAWSAGARVVYTPYAALTHYEGLTRGRSNPVEDMEQTAADLSEMAVLEDPYFHPELSAHKSEPTLRVAPEPSPWKTLENQVRHFLAPRHPASALDLFDDASLSEVARGYAWRWPQRATAGDAETTWGAVRFVVDLLRTDPTLRAAFPLALSEGVDGAFCRWLCGEGGDTLRLSPRARAQVHATFSRQPGRRVRQIYELRDDLRQTFPLGLTPAGRRELFRWLVVHAPGEHGVRPEETWWFLLECAENPEREIVRTYGLRADWQRCFPDGLTVFGGEALAAWLRERHGIGDAPWLIPSRWPVSLTPLEEIRLGYAAHETWRRAVPDAFADGAGVRALVAWLRERGIPSPERYSEWWAQAESELAVDGLVGLNVLGHFCYTSGLQASVRSIVESLRRVGVKTASRDVPTQIPTDTPGHGDYLGLEVHDVSLLHVQPEPYFETVYRQAGLVERDGVYRVGLWYWELETAPPEWGQIARSLDEIWAPTHFVARALEPVISMPVIPMMPGVELKPFRSQPRSHFGLRDDRLVFFFMFDMVSIMERKNPHALIDAFARAFRRDDPVQLVVKTARGDHHPTLIRELRRAAERVGALVIDEVLSREDSYALMDACDCYVSLHRSEGFGLTMAEAMLMGKPVIATAYSGNLDFMDEHNSLLVDCRVVPLERDIPPYRRGFRWGEPSVEHAVRHLRWVYEHPEAARALGARARQDVAERLSLEAAGRRIAARLQEIRVLRAARKV